MATLNIYNATGDFFESHEITGSLMSWIESNCPSFDGRVLFEAVINGKTFNYKKQLASEIVDLYLKPQGPAFQIALFIVAVASGYYAYRQAKKFNNEYQSSAQNGKSIYSANAKANSIVPSGVIREIAGKPTIYPDLICPPRRLFIDHEEWLYLMLSVGRGYFDLKDENIYISETPIINYIGDITVNIYEPGDTVTGNEAHENWFQSKEIQNLRLTTVSELTAGAWTVDYNGNTITSYLDGSEEPFPYQASEIFELTTGSNQGIWKVESIGSPNSTAVISKQQYTGGDTAQVEMLTQQLDRIRSSGFFANPAQAQLQINRNIIEAAAITSPVLTTATGESVDWQSKNGGVNWEGPFVITPENETAQFCEVDINFPRGLATLDGNNNPSSTTVEIEIQWREYGTGDWSTVSGTSYTASTFDEQAHTIEIDFGSSIRPEIRIRRVTKDADQIEVSDQVEVVRVKAKLETPTSYSGITTIAMKLRGTNSLAGSSENKINIRGASRKLPTISELQSASQGGSPIFNLRSANTTVDTSWNPFYSDFISQFELDTDKYTPDSSTADVSFHSVDFSSNGLKMVTYTDGILRSWDLARGYDIRDITYHGYVTVATSGSEVSVRYADSGTKIYLLTTLSGTTQPRLSERTLSTAYDITTSSASNTFDLTALANDPQSVYVHEDGTKFWVLCGTTNDYIIQYSMSAFDLSSASIPSPLVTFSVAGQTTTPRGLYMGDYTAGQPTKMYVLGSNGSVFTYTMSTPGDITTATLTTTKTTDTDTSVSDLYVSQEYFAISSKTNSGKFSPITSSIFVNMFYISQTSDSRASRSVMRFIGNALWETMGVKSNNLVDLDTLSTLDTLLENREDYLDAEFVDETTLYEALKIMLAPGYCDPCIKDGKFAPVRIAAGSDHSHLYTPDVMLDDGLTIDADHYDDQEPDGVEVEYFSLVTNQMEVIQCLIAGDAAVRPKRVQAIGIVDETKAWRFGMRIRHEMVQKPRTFNFSTELDALNSNYGDAIGVASELFASQCGEVTAYSAPNATLDFTPSFAAGTNYAAFRNTRGQFSGLYTVTQGSPNNVVTITSSPLLDFVPITDGSMDSTFMSIGDSNSWGKRAIVRQITHQSDNIVQVVASEYVAAVYQDDDNSPP